MLFGRGAVMCVVAEHFAHQRYGHRDLGRDQADGAERTARHRGKGIDAPRGEADDLKRITTISPKLEQRLNDAGVFHFWQIADLDADNTKALDLLLKLKGQIEGEGWIAQAKKFVDAAAA